MSKGAAKQTLSLPTPTATSSMAVLCCFKAGGALLCHVQSSPAAFAVPEFICIDNTCVRPTHVSHTNGLKHTGLHSVHNCSENGLVGSLITARVCADRLGGCPADRSNQVSEWQ